MIETNVNPKVNNTYHQADTEYHQNHHHGQAVIDVNSSDYSTNTNIVHANKRTEKQVQNSLFKINQRRCIM